MVDIISFEDFKYKGKYEQITYYEFADNFGKTFGNTFSREFKVNLYEFYKEFNLLCSYNLYLEELIEEVKSKKVELYPYVAERVGFIFANYKEEYDRQLKFQKETYRKQVLKSKLYQDEWYENLKQYKIEEIKKLFKPITTMKDSYKELTNFINTNSYTPFQLFFEDIFEKDSKKKVTFSEFFDKFQKEVKRDEKNEIKNKSMNKELLSVLDRKYFKSDEYDYYINKLSDRLEVFILCPNVLKDEISITIEDKSLIVTKTDTFYHHFKPKFKKIVFDEDLSNIDVTNITSKLENGVLTIILPKLIEKKDEPISIKVN